MITCDKERTFTHVDGDEIQNSSFSSVHFAPIQIMKIVCVFVVLFCFNFFELSMSADWCNGAYCSATQYCEREGGHEYCATYAGANKPCSFGWCPGSLKCIQGICQAENTGGGSGEYCDGVYCQSGEYCVSPPQPADAPQVRKYCSRTNTGTNQGEYCDGVYCQSGEYCVSPPQPADAPQVSKYCSRSNTGTNQGELCNGVPCPSGQRCHWDGSRNYCVGGNTGGGRRQGEYCNGKYCRPNQKCIQVPRDGGFGGDYCASMG